MTLAQGVVSEECAALAFYGIERTGSDGKGIEGFYTAVTQWLNERACPPNKMGVDGPGHSGKLISFGRGAAKLAKAGFAGVTVIEVTRKAPDAGTSGGDYLAIAAYTIKREKFPMLHVVTRTSVASLSHEAMLPLARTLIETSNPAYGIGFRRELELGPEHYVFGVGKGLGYSPADMEEERRISLWITGMSKQVWREGLLRDVYPWNFLTDPHLTRKIGDLSLEDWVRENPRRGKLAPLSRGMTLWEVDPCDLDQVRKAVWDAGAVYHVEPYKRKP